MPKLRQRLDRLENTMSPKHYLWVDASAGESREHALERACNKAGIVAEQVGAAVFFGSEIVSVDYGGHNGVETLAGYFTYEDALRALYTRNRLANSNA